MIETSNSEIDVSALMERVRREAAKIGRRTPENGRLHKLVRRYPVLPAIPQMPALPPLGMSRPLDPTKERIDERLQRAREMSDNSRIPKMFRRWFRKQGGYNRTVLGSVAALVNTSVQINKRVQELAIIAEQQNQWLRALAGQRQTEESWLRTAAPIISDSTAAIEQLHASLGNLTQHLEVLRVQADRASQHLAGLQDQADRSSQHLRDLQGEADRSSQHLGNLQVQSDRQAELVEAWHKGAAEHLRNLQDQTDRQGEQLRDGREQVQVHREHVQNLQNQADGHDTHLQRLQEQAAKLGGELQHRLALLEERQVNDAIYVKGELSHYSALLQQRRPSVGKNKEPSLSEGPLAHRLDNFYLSFENRFRGKRSQIKERVRFYLPFLKEAKAGLPTRPIVDVGCGRGEWLELLQENGLKAAGVDLNSAMVAQCTERKLQVTQADAIAYLRALPANSQGAVSGFHIIEHLPFEVLMDLFAETRRVLKPGGLAIFESPNCKNLTVGACNFYADPTHRNPVFPETAQFSLSTLGFENVELHYLTPVDTMVFDSPTREAAVLNQLFYGPQDFSVIGHKPKASRATSSDKKASKAG